MRFQQPATGTLDRRITIMRAGTTRNAVNAPVLSFSDIDTIWSTYEPVSDSERLMSGQMNAQTIARFQVRYTTETAAITPKDRLRLNGKIYDVTAVKEMIRHKWIEITAAARTDGG